MSCKLQRTVDLQHTVVRTLAAHKTPPAPVHCTPEKKFKQFDDSLKINRHTKLSSSYYQVFFLTPNSLMIVLITPNYHQLLLDTENYRKTIIK